MNRILLAGINARYTHSNPALYYLRNSIPAGKHDVSIVEYTISERPERVAGDIIARRPDILALSVYIWNAEIVKRIIKVIKVSLPEAKIVLGGPEVSYSAGDWLSAFSEIDCIITGGGEHAFRELLLAKDFPSGRKIAGRNPHFGEIPFPYNESDMERLKGRYIYYESSRGCPFRCSYCLSSVYKGSVEYRGIEQVKNELSFFAGYNPPLVKFIDRTFNLNKDHFLPVWEFIVEKFAESGTCFHFEIFPELLDDGDIRFLSGVPRGLFQFEMGIQSVNSAALSAIDRPGEWPRAERNIKKLAEPGNIHLHADLIAGLPYEGIESFEVSFNSVYSAGADHLQCGFLKVLPGTVMYSRAEEYGMRYNLLPPYEVAETKWLAPDDVLKLKVISELVDLFHNSGRFIETEKFMLSLYSDPFTMYCELAGRFTKDEDASHRRWEYIASMVISLIKADKPRSVEYLTDSLRWDWCSVMKHHHLPAILKSASTVCAKRIGYRFFSVVPGDMIEYQGTSFKKEDLRRAIFFSPESEQFRMDKMTGEMAMFLPDKRVVFFDPGKG